MDCLINILSPIIFFGVLVFLSIFSYRFISVLEKINDSLNNLVYVLSYVEFKKKDLP